MQHRPREARDTPVKHFSVLTLSNSIRIPIDDTCNKGSSAIHDIYDDTCNKGSSAIHDIYIQLLARAYDIYVQLFATPTKPHH